MNNTIAFIVVLLIFRKFIIENRRGGQFLKVNLFIIIFMGAGYGRCPASGRGGVTVDAGGAVTWTREGHCLLRHPRAAGIPYGGAVQYVVVTVAEPFGGFPRGARE